MKREFLDSMYSASKSIFLTAYFLFFGLLNILAGNLILDGVKPEIYGMVFGSFFITIGFLLSILSCALLTLNVIEKLRKGS